MALLVSAPTCMGQAVGETPASRGIPRLGESSPAATLVVLPDVKVTGTGFEVDERAGRARISVELVDESFESAIRSESVAVPGLTFDRERREVVYQHDGATMTCAVRKKVLWAASYAATGACPVTVRREPRRDGEDLETRATTWVVELATSEAARSTSLKR